MRTSVPHGHAKALAVAHHHVCPHRSRRLNQGTGQQIRRHHDPHVCLVGTRDKGIQRLHPSRIIRVLDKDAKHVLSQRHLILSNPLNADAQMNRTALQHRPGLGKYTFGNDETVHT